MQGAGSGTVFGGRYALSHRLSQVQHLEQWSAHDATLEREVTLTIVSSEHPHRAAVLDAARRSAGVEDTRLVRILDVGTQNDTSFIVHEAMSESESLASLLLQGPLPVEEARRVAGESARGLAAAGQRGLHHLRLTPHDILIAPDGAIRVTGVAVAAAIDGPGDQEPDADTASRRDTRCVVAILYAALTSRWPLDEEVPGMETAPKMVDGVVAPSQIATAVPEDLDDLCRTTLNLGNGPLTPSELANRLAPWPRDRVQRVGAEPTVVLHLPSEDDLTDGDGAFTRGPAPAREPAPAGPAPTVTIPAPVGDEGVMAGATTTQAFSTPVADGASTAGSTAGSAMAPDKPGSPTAAAEENGARTDAAHGTARMTLPDGLRPKQLDDVGPPLPLLPASTANPPARGQSTIVVLVVALFVALALFVGYRGLKGLTSDSSQGSPAAKRAVTVTAPPVATPASPAPQAGTNTPIAILSATGFDPEGDKTEGDSKAARVYDGDLGTSWTSSRYSTADFGNLKKGVGVILDLGQPTSIHQVSVDLGQGPIDFKVYAATDPGIADASVIGRARDASGQVQLKAPDTLPQAQYVIVWFTSLAPDGGQFRAAISEIALS